MRDKNYPMTPREQVISQLLDKIKFDLMEEIVPLRQSLGRVAAMNLYSANTLPNAPTSKMDGIAIRFNDYQRSNGDTSLWEIGREYQFCNTGVALPDGYDTVILIEEVEIDAQGQLQIKVPPPMEGQQIGEVGHVLREGDLLVPQYRLLKPYDLGLLASGGINDVPVLKKPVVAFIPTGNELSPAGVKPPRGKNVESNSIMIDAFIRNWGGEPMVYPVIKDVLADVVAALDDALAKADIVILNAGSSKGSDDCTVTALQSVGQILTYRVDHGPGHHTSVTIARGKPVLGLVGPPGGAEITAEFYLQPLINLFLRQKNAEPQKLKAELLEDIEVRMGNDFYAPVVVKKHGEKYIVSICAYNELWKRNGSLKIPRGEENVPRFKAGQTVEVELKYPLNWIEEV
jgi:molybdopterin molybdotransferase/putative molybdopterin biosynthesis protein